MIGIKYCPSCGNEITLVYGDTEVTFYSCWRCRVGIAHQGNRAILIPLGCPKHQFVKDGVLRDSATIHEVMAGISKLYCFNCHQTIPVDRKEIFGVASE